MRLAKSSSPSADGSCILPGNGKTCGHPIVIYRHFKMGHGRYELYLHSDACQFNRMPLIRYTQASLHAGDYGMTSCPSSTVNWLPSQIQSPAQHLLRWSHTKSQLSCITKSHQKNILRSACSGNLNMNTRWAGFPACDGQQYTAILWLDQTMTTKERVCMHICGGYGIRAICISSGSGALCRCHPPF